MSNFSIFLGIGIAAGASGVLAFLAISTENKFRSFDYHLNLQEDSIYILTDQDIDTTIHFDDIDEFLIRDNI